jgi:hypothetical protein
MPELPLPTPLPLPYFEVLAVTAGRSSPSRNSCIHTLPLIGCCFKWTVNRRNRIIRGPSDRCMGRRPPMVVALERHLAFNINDTHMNTDNPKYIFYTFQPLRVW